MRNRSFIALVTAAIVGLSGPASASHDSTPPPPTVPPRAPYTDVPSSHYADAAVAHVAEARDWLRVNGATFSPGLPVTRGLLARALVLAFAPTEAVDASLKFTDVVGTNWLYRYANIATQKGWMSAPGGSFSPYGAVTKIALDWAVVRALDIPNVVNGINSIRTEDGYRFKHYTQLGYSVVASQLRMHYNYPNAARRELLPFTKINRAEAAYALFKAATAGDGYRLASLDRYAQGIVLPRMGPTRRKIVEFALNYTSYPYHYAGTSPSVGFDCSGFIWWVLKSGVGPASRGYTGWSLPDRTSYYMAKNAPVQVARESLITGDIMTWDTDGEYTRAWQGVGHAGIYLGNGWTIHSSGGRGGVSIDRTDRGYWYDRFVWGRRLAIPA